MKVYSYFLPQFHRTPKNDKYWGEGFTDWDNVRRSKSLNPTHLEPVRPADFGYYDLGSNSALRTICDWSVEQGIDALVYWHYWFDKGVQALEKVQEMHLSDSKNNQNFFFAWANSDWTKSWVGDDSTVIYSQIYSRESALAHFDYLIDFIEDSRYVRYNGKPIIQVNNPDQKGCLEHLLLLEANAVEKYGIGFYWLFPEGSKLNGFSNLNYGLVGFPPGDITALDIGIRVRRRLQKLNIIKAPIRIKQKKYLKLFGKKLKSVANVSTKYYPSLLAGWDNTPRYGKKGFFISCEVEDLLKAQLEILRKLQITIDNTDFIFIKAMNEWAEGNVLEPYMRKGAKMHPAKMINFNIKKE